MLTSNLISMLALTGFDGKGNIWSTLWSTLRVWCEWQDRTSLMGPLRSVKDATPDLSPMPETDTAPSGGDTIIGLYDYAYRSFSKMIAVE
jgi:hypothetical protein